MKESNFELKNTDEGLEKDVSFEDSLNIAKQLLEKYGPQIRENLGKDVNNFGGLVFEDYQDAISHFLKLIPDQDKEFYSAHGVTRRDDLNKLAAALNIMSNKAIKGYSGLIAYSSQFSAFTHKADFLILSKFLKPLRKQDVDGKFYLHNQNNDLWDADIGAFVVNTKFYPMVEEFKKMYPDVNIIKANQLPEYFIKEEGK